MQEEIKTKWVAALRSGEYKQGTRALKYKDGPDIRHCCLGVLCDLAVAEGVIPDPRLIVGGLGIYSYAGSPSYLPDEVRAWAGLETSNPVIRGRFGSDNLAGLNDAGYAFEDIARIIEENF